MTSLDVVVPGEGLERSIMTIRGVRVMLDRLRTVLAAHADLAQRIDELEQRYDSQFEIVFDAIRRMMALPETKHRRVGFRTGAAEEAP